MTDLAKGIFEVNNYAIKPGTKIEEMKSFFGNKVRVLDLSIGPRLKFQKPYFLTENLYVYSFDFNKDGVIRAFSIIPVAPPQIASDPVTNAKFKIMFSKKWLKDTLIQSPTSEGKESILYSFEWGYIRSSTQDDVHYGLLGGEINISFNDT